MLILPVRPQPPYLRIQESNDSSATASSSTTRPEQDPRLASEPPSQPPGTMISVMPPLKPPIPKRPKLSLQTFAAASLAEEKSETDSLLSPITDTPIYSNIFAGVFGPPPSTPVSIPKQESESQVCAHDEPSPPSSDSSSTTSTFSGLASPFPGLAPYTLPIGARSILLNSPLPRRHLSAVSTRISRRMFQPVKRVMFREELEDIVPRRMIDFSPDNSDSDSSEKRPRATFEACQSRGLQTTEAEDVPSTPIQRRRKRRREWVWRPLDDDVLAEHINDGMAFRSPGIEPPSADDAGTDEQEISDGPVSARE